MTGLFLALLIQAPSTNPIDRFAALMRAHPSFTVKFTVQFTGQRGPWNGEFATTAPTVWRCGFQQGVQGAAIVRNGSVACEFDDFGRLFAVVRTQPEPNLIESVMFPWSNYALPVPLMLRSITATFPPTLKPVIGPPAADGTALVSVDAKDRQGELRLRYWIAADGRLLRCDIHVQSPEGTVDQSFKFNAYSWERPKPSLFDTSIPVGYTPFLLPRPAGSADPERSLRLGSWQTSDGKLADLDRKIEGKATVVALLDPESSVSRRAGAYLPGLASQLNGKAKVVALVAGAPGSIEVDGIAAYYDPSRKAFDAIVAPGYPAYYLLDSTRKPIRAWMGDIPARRAAMFKEIVEAVAD